MFKKLVLFYVCACLCIMCTLGAHRGQKRILDSLELELQTVKAAMWTLGSGPRLLEKQSVFLTTEPLLQTHDAFF